MLPEGRVTGVLHLNRGKAGGPFFYLFKSKYAQKWKRLNEGHPNALAVPTEPTGKLREVVDSLRGLLHFARKQEEKSLSCSSAEDRHSNLSSTFSPAIPTAPGFINSGEITARIPRESLSAPITGLSVKGKQQMA